MVEFGIPKLLILCLLLLCGPEHPEHSHLQDRRINQSETPRMWNREIPTTGKWDALDLFSGTGLVKACHLHGVPCCWFEYRRDSYRRNRYAVWASVSPPTTSSATLRWISTARPALRGSPKLDVLVKGANTHVFTTAHPGKLFEFEAIWPKVGGLGVRMQPLQMQSLCVAGSRCSNPCVPHGCG